MVWRTNLIVTTCVLVKNLEIGGCSGFLIKCVYRTYTGYISLCYMAICIEKIQEFHVYQESRTFLI